MVPFSIIKWSPFRLTKTYYGVTDNFEAIRRFEREVEKLLFRWLNRRGNRRSLTWAQFNLMRKRFPLPRPRL